MTLGEFIQEHKNGTFRVIALNKAGRMFCAPIYRKGEDLVSAIAQAATIADAKLVKLVPMDGKVIDFVVAA